MREQVDAPRTPPAGPIPPVLCARQGATRIASEYEESFHFYARGNALKKAECDYQPDALERTVRQADRTLHRASSSSSGSGYGCDDPLADLHRRPAARGIDAAGADPRLALAGRRHDGAGRHPAPRELASTCTRAARAIPAPLRCCRRTIIAASAKPISATRGTTAVGNKPFFIDKMPNNFRHFEPDPPDAAEREDHRRAARTHGLLLQQLQTAVRVGPAIHLQSRRHRPLLRDVCAAHGSLGRGPARSRLARPARGRDRRSRGQRAANAGFLRARLSSRPASSSTRPSGACIRRVRSRCAGPSTARASISGGISSPGSGRCARHCDPLPDPERRG